NINEVCDVNPFGVEALQAAYSSKGAEWLEQLNAYLYDNYLCLCEFFENNLPQFPVTKLEGTYLVWVDCSVLGKPSDELCGELLQAQGLYLNEGTMYGTSGIDFVRINIACPRAVLIEGLQRFKNYVVY
ncbi:MAG: cystathionine beta-lyase, partial [Bacteroidaceae bacterium]|nr:cystathionine beta-lyase [Bacteroidaceae bacterium]